MAGERTLLAWIRTGLSLMGFGFVVARFGLFLREMTLARHLPPARSHGVSMGVGTALVILGVLVNAAAALQHARFTRRYQRGEPYRPASASFGILVALALAILGLGMAVYLLATVR